MCVCVISVLPVLGRLCPDPFPNGFRQLGETRMELSKENLCVGNTLYNVTGVTKRSRGTRLSRIDDDKGWSLAEREKKGMVNSQWFGVGELGDFQVLMKEVAVWMQH